MPKKVRTESKSNKLENPNKLDWKKKRRQEHLEKNEQSRKRCDYYRIQGAGLRSAVWEGDGMK